ncbi:hypothetical protein TESG_01624 [Trichophyton tonsurans CBS 112818]|uniref:Uncharacterized protein n=1 Tax=Trichophyton tonsurans (strain CBS 112818) TaxID=647933 RepID=F2RRZ9_TRIT1|nr:hypothetical protein TESG_01624 [Trichophyton tonsurans CBS 112818]
MTVLSARLCGYVCTREGRKAVAMPTDEAKRHRPYDEREMNKLSRKEETSWAQMYQQSAQGSVPTFPPAPIHGREWSVAVACSPFPLGTKVIIEQEQRPKEYQKTEALNQSI